MQEEVYYHGYPFKLTGSNNAAELVKFNVQGATPLTIKEYIQNDQVVKAEYYLDEAMTDLALREERSYLLAADGTVTGRQNLYIYYDTTGAIGWTKSQTKHYVYL